MFSLISFTIITSLADSLNPFAIAQQFTLQGLLKKTHHIWYYILTIFATNYLAGFILYVGVAALNEQFLTKYWTVLDKPLAIIAFIASIGIFWYSIRSLLMNWRLRKKLAAKSYDETKELEIKFSKKTMTVSSLIGIGLTTTLVELTTAAPFIAYLTVVQQFQPTLVQLLLLLFIYNIIFAMPLIVLYFLFVGFQSTFEKIYQRLNSVLQIVSALLLPILFFLIALLLIMFAGSVLLN